MCLIECCFCAPLSHVFKRSAFRHLDKNLGLSGTIPAQLCALVELNTLYGLNSFWIKFW